MGLTLEFHAGDKSRIAKAIQESDLEVLGNPDVSKFNVDLSLHITPHDLDLLSASFGEAKLIPPLQLRKFLKVMVDEEDRGALGVDQDWINYIAATDAKFTPIHGVINNAAYSGCFQAGKFVGSRHEGTANS